MNKNFISFLCALMCCTMAFSQTTTTTPFSCSTTSPSYVIGFKNGTNCTVAPYNVYTMSLGGTISTTPLFTTPDSIEIQGIGINSVDSKGYALWYRRDNNSTPNTCVNDTVKLIRFGANGAQQLLGYISQPQGYTISTALGTMGANGNYYFGANINGQLAVGMISNVAALAGGTGALTASYRTVVNLCGGRIFSDWAFNPATPNVLYTYGISINANNQVAGVVMTIDLSATTVNLVMNCVAGTETTGTFTDLAQDNFGGIMFGTDGNMYGVNVNTRRYYRINPNTGAITLISTIPANGSGTPTTSPMRTDLGSCVSSSPPARFSCGDNTNSSTPSTYVVGFKNGTNCTVAPHNVYTMSLTGTLSPTPLFTTPDTIEVNGIGINSSDGYGYALRYRRDNNTTPNTCINDTVKVIRFDASGAVTLLGYIAQPAGYTIGTALGTVGYNNNYVFGANINGQLSVGTIANISSLPAGTGPITATYRTIINNCGGRIFSDWAFRPLNIMGGMNYTNILYTYGISINANNQVAGVVMTIDLNAVTPNVTMNCVPGTEKTGTFTDIAQDNMGGVMFGEDGFMYVLDVSNRKYFRVNPDDGTIIQVNTIAANGSGTPTTSPLRTDLGSCVPIRNVNILPIGFSNFSITSGGSCKAVVSWQADGVETGDKFVIEKSYDGRNFSAVTEEKGVGGVTNYSIIDSKPGITNYYRIKGVSKNGDIKYSTTVRFLSSCGGRNNVTLFQNLITGTTTVSGEISLYKSQAVTATVYNATGVKVFSKVSTATAGVSRFSYDISTLSKGVYLLQTVIGEERFTEKFIVQ